jgi:uncharacterized protein (DUF169 family)
MIDYAEVESKLGQQLSLTRRPVAIAFLDAPPAGIPAFQGSVPSGCSFWRLAAEGRSFYTVPGDHYNCPIGSYTHNISLPEARSSELPQVLNIMSDIGYLRMEEVPGIAQLPETPKYVAYSPLADARFDPDVVIVSGKPGRMMLLTEASIRAGVNSGHPLLARPTCMAIPLALESGLVSSAGCIGNRVYTDVSEDDLYSVVRGADLPALTAELDTIVSANSTLVEYHTERRRQLATI